ncbi:MAG: DUF3307 domain-containing protein [Bacteroidetes bacterium]|nr:DUF3307 domain-containing protein [Bacteroidota bacterium]
MNYVLLFLLLFICHFLGDFVFTNSTMLEAKQKGSPLSPIFMHAGIHSMLMTLTLLFFVDVKTAAFLGSAQWISHFIIDVWKGKMNVWFPKLADNKNKSHWIIFGFDQLLHQICILAMIYSVKEFYLVCY